MKDINFLWQDHSAHDDLTAERIAKINPDKLIVNVDGPGSDIRKLTQKINRQIMDELL